MEENNDEVNKIPAIESIEPTSHEKVVAQTEVPKEAEHVFPEGMVVAMIMLSLWLAMFLVALVIMPNNPLQNYDPGHVLPQNV